MKTLKYLAAPLALAMGVTGFTATASAATPYRAAAIERQIDALQMRVGRNDMRDRISPREATGLRRDIQRLRADFRMYNRDGLNPREMQYLNSRIANVRDRLHWERSDWDNRRW